MAEFTLEEIITATGGTLLQGNSDRTVIGIATDSRVIQPGELFLALKGERFDGHVFLKAAVQSGAVAVLVMDYPVAGLDLPVIKVDDTLTALGRIAKFHRRRFSIPVVGITGSNGKTTTKDLLTSVLAASMEVVSTEGNFNNEIGLPLTLLRITGRTQAAVVEMGMRGLGQIRQLAGFAEPNIVVITNVGLTHLEILGTIENIALAKQELVESLPSSGLAVLNGDDPLVRRMGKATTAKTVFYGLEGDDLAYRGRVIRSWEEGSAFMVDCGKEQLELTIPLPGRHNILNALAVVAAGKELGVSNQVIQKGLVSPNLTGKRLKMITRDGYRIIDDTYNASPTSVKASLDVLAEAGRSKRKIAVLADMLELGPTAAALHYETGVYAGKIGIDYLFAFGTHAKEYILGFESISEKRGEYFSSKPALSAYLKQIIKPGDLVLVKGSRGMKMEDIIADLCGEEVNP